MQKEFKPTALINPTVVFVEAPWSIFYSDAQVIARLLTMIEQDEELRAIYPYLKQTFYGKYFDEIIEMLEKDRTSINPLLEHVAWDTARQFAKDGDVVSFCNESYDVLLYESDIIDVPYVPTASGNAIRVLSKDRNLKKLYLYAKRLPKSLRDELELFLRTGTCPIEFIVGDNIQLAIQEANPDFLFLRDIQSVTALLDDRMPVKIREVIVPGYPCNANFYTEKIAVDSLQNELDLFATKKITVSYLNTSI